MFVKGAGAPLSPDCRYERPRRARMSRANMLGGASEGSRTSDCSRGGGSTSRKAPTVTSPGNSSCGGSGGASPGSVTS
jgi:hypothetical protein